MLHPAYHIDPPPPEPDEDYVYELHRDAEGRAGSGDGAVAQPSPERRGAGPGGGTLAGSSLAAVRSSAEPLPPSFATLADRRYLGRVARVIPSRSRPFNWAVEGL